jgi:hypothetical protein
MSLWSPLLFFCCCFHGSLLCLRALSENHPWQPNLQDLGPRPALAVIAASRRLVAWHGTGGGKSILGPLSSSVSGQSSPSASIISSIGAPHRTALPGARQVESKRSRVCHHFEGIRRTLLLLVVIEKHLRRKINDRFENHPLGPQLTFPVCPPSDSTAVGLVFVPYCLLSLKQHKDPIYKSTSANVHHPSHPSHPKTPGCRTMR